MKRIVGFFLAMILMFSFCFVLPGLTQETKEAEGVYTIKKGDTLWDISARFLKDPFLWPKLWERNPYITNPHWIYPGNPVQLTGVEPLKKAEVKEEPKTVEEEKPKTEGKPEEVVKEPEAKPAEPTPAEKKPEAVVEEKPTPPERKPVVVAEKPAPVEEKPVYFREIRDAGFMSDVEYRGIGIILESKEGKNLLSAGDIIYLAFQTSEPILIGSKYTIFRAAREINHPISGKRIGRKYLIVGNVQLIDQQSGFFTARIIESFDVIFIGDYIQPYSKEKMEGVAEK